MKKLALGSLVFVNLIPVLGILVLDWDLFSILFFYWLESAVVGVYNIPRMIMVGPGSSETTRATPVNTRKHRASGVIFFLMHYSVFMAGHGFFI